MNGEKIDDSRDLARKIAELHSNTDVKLSIIRYGEKREVTMKLGTFPNSKKLAALEDDKKPGVTSGQEMKDLGLSLAPAAKVSGAGDEGVVITDVDPSSDAADKGLKAGDVDPPGRRRDRVGARRRGQSRKDSDGQTAKDKDKVIVLVQVRTGDQTRFVALSLTRSKA